jgi:hypothetical protein
LKIPLQSTFAAISTSSQQSSEYGTPIYNVSKRILQKKIQLRQYAYECNVLKMTLEELKAELEAIKEYLKEHGLLEDYQIYKAYA